MKKVNVFSLGFIYAGCFLGAGCVSGQELMQFFGSFGIRGFFGVLISVIIQFALSVIVFKYVHKTKTTEFDRIVVKPDIPLLRAVVGITAAFFMYGVVIIMSAGAGELAERAFGIPLFVGCGVFCLVLSLLTIYGVDGIIPVLSRIVPILVAGTVCISIVCILKSNILEFDYVNYFNSSQNPLLGNWLFSSITYVSYNLFLSIAIIVPIAERTNYKTIVPGVLFGCLILLLVIYSILGAIFSDISVSAKELPMLELAYNISIKVGIIYSLLLLLGMFVAALSCFVAVLEYGNNKWNFSKNKKITIIFLLGVLAWLLSLVGFGRLIGIVYPICGYFGFISIIGTIINYINSKDNV
ncbi:MAG: hypothetical protein IJQ50_02100 [Clostridia bacterium]|nr:hypothetical protein [Clostridia bacterium]